MSAIMFRGRNRLLARPPEEGDRVVVTGRAEVYAASGRLSFIVERLETTGDGDARRRLEELKRKLQAEGLFDPGRKRKLPAVPRAVGVVTSPTGAAFQDILRVTGQRFPTIPIVLAPCLVQGEGAADSIVRALGWVQEHGLADVVIVGRGGGSREDLAAFDTEPVVRAVAACRIPVVSAVGHEVDVSLCDLAADVRAATPSHASELVVPDRDQLSVQVDDLDRRMEAAVRRAVARRRELLTRIRVRGPAERLAQERSRLGLIERNLLASPTRLVTTRRRGLEAAVGRLEALSPLSVLQRGYAVVFKDGHAVLKATEVQRGDRLLIRLHQGEVEAVAGTGTVQMRLF